MSGINKNFVVKNGFEVNQDLLYADADLNKIGIGTANPAYTLDVIGDIGISGGIGIGGTTGLSGQYLISTGAGVTWSSFTSSLRVGFNTVANTGQTSFSTTYNVGLIDVFVNGVRLTDSEYTANDGNTVVLNANCFGGEIVDIIAYSPANSGFATNLGGGGGESYWTQNSTGIHTLSNVGIGTTNATETLTVFGDARVTGILTIGTASITLDGSNNNAYIGSGVSVYGDTGEIYLFGEKLQGIGNSSNINTSGIITASYFYGDGSNLTGISGGGGIGSVFVDQIGYGCTSPITSIGSTLGISSSSNAYGTRYVSTVEPPSPCDGDIWYQPGTGGSGGGGGALSYCCTNNITSTNLTSHPDITSASNNFFVGSYSGNCVTSGSFNNFLGSSAGYYNTTGYNNNFFGACAGYYNTEGRDNHFFGACAGYYNTTGDKNLYLARYAGYCNTTGSMNIILGDYSYGSCTGDGNFLGGYAAGYGGMEGSYNNFFGWYAGSEFQGCYNNIMGYCGGYYGSGDYNNIIGAEAGCCNTGNYNNLFGYCAGLCNQGCENNFIGAVAGSYNSTGSFNNFFGSGSGCYNTTGSYNNFMGTSAGRYNTSGEYNNFIGVAAGINNNAGSFNNFFGCDTGACNVSGCFNNFFGGGAGYFNVSGSCNTFLGENTGGANTTGSENVIIGYNRNTPIINGNNQLAIGAGSTDWIVGNSSYNIGIGTTNPIDKLTVQNGNIRVGVDTSNGLILTDSNGVSWKLIVSTSGVLSTVPA